jgi:hypothetical protein
MQKQKEKKTLTYKNYGLHLVHHGIYGKKRKKRIKESNIEQLITKCETSKVNCNPIFFSSMYVSARAFWDYNVENPLPFASKKVGRIPRGCFHIWYGTLIEVLFFSNRRIYHSLCIKMMHMSALLLYSDHKSTYYKIKDQLESTKRSISGKIENSGCQ